MSAPSEWIQRRTAIALGVLATGALVTAVVLMTVRGKHHGSYGNDSFSYSAIGYRALVEVLEQWQIPVIRSRSLTRTHRGKGRVQLIAEPYPERLSDWETGPKLRAPGVTVWIVVPKWVGLSPGSDRGTVGSVSLLAVSEVESVLSRILKRVGLSGDARGCVSRQALGTVTSTPPLGALTLTLAEPQLLKPGCLGLQPLIGTPEGMLIAANAERSVVVVADPDLLNNYGLRKNLTAAWQLVNRVLKPRAVIIDETIHGYRRSDSFWAELWEFPLVLFTMQLMAFILLAVWAGLRRFGNPLPTTLALAKGKAALIDNTSRLLEIGNYEGHALRRYFDLVLRDVARHYGIAADVATLSKIAAARGVPERLEQLSEVVQRMPDRVRDARKVRSVALKLYQWRNGMIRRR